MYQRLRKNWRNPFLLNLLLSLHRSLLALCFAFISFFNTLLLRIIVNKNIVTKKMVLLIASFYFNRIFSGTRTTSFREKCKIRKLNWLHVIRLYILVNVNEIQMSKKKKSLRHLTDWSSLGVWSKWDCCLSLSPSFLSVKNFLVHEMIYCSWSLCPRHKHVFN